MPSVATRRWDTKAPSTLKRNTPGRWPIEQPHTCPPQGVHSNCGANIGCASAFFLNRYPGSCVVAIEAELGNFGICRQNLEPYGSRVRAIHGAVWPRSEPLIVVRGEPEQVKEWAFSVRPCRDGEP